jgi:tetratricopeptide (TPR) repeat protein
MLHQAGQALVQLGAREAAIAAFRRAVSADPGLAAAWYSLGLALQDARQFADAASAFDEARRLRPDFHEAAFNAGIAWQETGDLETALDAYAAAYRLRPESFGRIAQALIASPKGALWLRPSALRAILEIRGAT